MITIRFDGGTIEARNIPQDLPTPPFVAWDARAGAHRTVASSYADLVRWLVREKIPFEDHARNYGELQHGVRVHREPRPYQREALEAWTKARGRGVVVLPTGAGKTHVAVMAIEEKKRDTLVVAPTLDLVRQWFDLLECDVRR